jgi:hypothetical protein
MQPAKLPRVILRARRRLVNGADYAQAAHRRRRLDVSDILRSDCTSTQRQSSLLR